MCFRTRSLALLITAGCHASAAGPAPPIDDAPASSPEGDRAVTSHVERSGEPASTSAARAGEPAPDQAPAPADTPRHGRVLQVEPPPKPAPAGDAWGLTAEPLPEAFGCSGFGQIGLRPTSWPSLTAERDFMDAELRRVRRELRELRVCVRDWDQKLADARAARRVDKDRIAELKRRRAQTLAAIESVKRQRAGYRARRAALQAELDRRRALIESGVCPSEPCPPGTQLPPTR